MSQELTPRESFKVGFLAACIDEGLSPAQIQERMQQAAVLVEKRADLSNLLGLGLTTAVAVPVGLGAAGGFLAAKAREEPVSDEDVKREELLREYRRLTQTAKQQTKLRALRRPTF